jgi:hypothetical protein
MPDGVDKDFVEAVLEAAPKGATAVQAELKRRLLSPLEQAEQELENGRPEAPE